MRKNQAIYRQVGTPSIKQVRQIATRLYLLTLQEHYGWISLGKLQKVLLKEADQSNLKYWLQNSRRFYKNMRGCVIRDRKLIDHIEERVPGSRRLFDHPLWLILEHPDASLDDIYKMMRLLHPSVERRLFNIEDNTGNRIRKTLRNRHEVHLIAMRGDLDTLAFALMLVREMELLNRLDPCTEAKWAAHHIISTLTIHPPFFLICQQIYDLAYQYFISKKPFATDETKVNILHYFHKEFRLPIYVSDFYRYMDINSTILWYAKLHKILDDRIYNQMQFLYITKIVHNLADIETLLKNLPADLIYNGERNSLPTPLNTIMHYLADKRRAFTSGTFLD